MEAEWRESDGTIENYSNHGVASWYDFAMAIQEYYNEIIAAYYKVVEPLVNVIEAGMWDGNLIKLAESPGLEKLIGWYCNIQATEYHTTALKFDDFLQFIDLEKYRIIEIGEEFELKSKRDLKIMSNEKYFENQFLQDFL